MEVLLVAVALINLHHFSTNFHEGWCREIKELLWGTDMERGTVFVCAPALRGNESFPMDHSACVNRISCLKGAGNFKDCGITHMWKDGEALVGWLKKNKRTTQLFTVSVLTDIGFSHRLSVHAFLVCRGFSHEHPQIGFGELEKHC